MDRSDTLIIGDHVWVDDELRTDIECVVRGFNEEGEPILQALDGPLRFRGCDRRVLDYPWDRVRKESAPTSLHDAVGEFLRQTSGTHIGWTSVGSLLAPPPTVTALNEMLDAVRRAWENECAEMPF